MKPELKKLFESHQYGFAGRHSAVKICTWAKKSLRDEDVCYKEKFYGIKSHLCCQMSPSVNYCQNQCIFCWRPIEHNMGMEIKGTIDEPKEIVDNCLKMHKILISGFGGNKKVNKDKLKEAAEPKHFAISLAGEPLAYTKISELIKEIHKRGMTSFLVTNGMLPEKLEKIEAPTQLYLSLDAPDKEIFKKIDQPLLKDAWERLNKSLEILKKLKRKTRTVIRITLVKGINIINPEGYAGLIKKAEPDFVEVKAFMWVGYARQRLAVENMPLHDEIMDFSKEILKHLNCYILLDEKKESRVVLLGKDDKNIKIK